MENSLHNVNKQHVVGERSTPLLSKESIQDYPFEWIMKMTSTRGRLFIWLNWEEISSLDSFKNQEFYKQVFGSNIHQQIGSR